MGLSDPSGEGFGFGSRSIRSSAANGGARTDQFTTSGYNIEGFYMHHDISVLEEVFP